MEFQTVSVVILFLTVVSTQEGILNKYYCSSGSDCGLFGYTCGQNGTCQCDKLYVASRSKEKCVGGIGQRCKYDEHCIEGAFCEHQVKCLCKDDRYPSFDGLSCSSSSRIIVSRRIFFSSMAVLCFTLSYCLYLI